MTQENKKIVIFYPFPMFVWLSRKKKLVLQFSWEWEDFQVGVV